MKKISIVQRIVPHYRIPFFDALAHNLASRGVELQVVYGQEYPGAVPKSVQIDNAWAVRIENYYGRISGKEIVWQPVYQYIKDADLVVIEQANRLVVNYLLLLLRRFTGLKLAFWGHGKNFQTQNDAGLLESWKRFISVNVDWWFTYTRKSARLVEAMGFNPLQITVVQNSIDTTALKSSIQSVSAQEQIDIKKRLGIIGNSVAIYCGGMYEEKKISFLIDACCQIRRVVPDFHVIIIGEGPDASLVINFSKQNNWVHYLGAITGDKRVPFFSVSKLLLMPGLVGLVVLDSFALETPMVTTNIPIHSPEFDYLSNGLNGVVTRHDVDEYSQTVADILSNEKKYLKLLEGCQTSSEQFTVENMAANFADGLISSLGGEQGYLT